VIAAGGHDRGFLNGLAAPEFKRARPGKINEEYISSREQYKERKGSENEQWKYRSRSGRRHVLNILQSSSHSNYMSVS